MTENRDSLLADCRRLMATGKWNEARSRLERALAAAPTDLLLAFSLATLYRESGAAAEALHLFGNIHRALPEMVEAAIGLAKSHAALGSPTQAVAVLQRQLIRVPDNMPLYTALGEVHLKAGDFKDVEPAFRRAVTITPDSSNSLTNIAEILSQKGRFAEADPFYLRAMKMEPDNQRLRLNYAVHLLSQGKVREGWRYFEARLDPQLPDAPVRALPLPRWDGSRPEAHHILVVHEQGLGDEIRFLARVPELAKVARHVTVESDPRLLGLLERSMPGLDVHPFSRHKRSGRGHFSYSWLPEKGGPDCYIEAGSLSLTLRTGLEPPDNAAGFLVPREDLKEKFRTELQALAAGRRIVGLSWTSSAQAFGRGTNYPPPESWRDLVDLPNTFLVSLQHDETGKATTAFESATGRNLHRIEGLDLRNDLEGLAALAASLDLMLSVGNATSTLAGAVGTKTIELLSSGGWAPLDGTRDNFLGATRRIKQTQLGDWSGSTVLARDLALELLDGG